MQGLREPSVYAGHAVVAKLTMRRLSLLICIVTAALSMQACGEPKGEDLSKVGDQPVADLEKGKNAQSIDEWAKANPDNGKPGSGEGSGH